jgi:NitT/TauT family transport system permease protein
MALLTNVIISIITIYNGFINTSKIKIKLFKSYKASDNQILYNLIIPSNKKTIISSLKINISLTLIGVIMGEFLVSKHGLGYLIIYGSQIFNLNIVITSLFILIIISYIIYKIIIILNEKVS